ncbi:FG-GAP-like repeat-containing protein [Nannocystis sp.]|uniref:FG-GAP repeat domain-containing protein n=1 Tax=Nannocystis sp. TaxID=1962667 RepID=UPI0025D90E5D|nr:FG-GAP-like repeat-containing protein [Nannocystis sp.]MBK7826800.1 VCBS repeat-containing protein [Nannocystis sp.]
MRVSLGLTVAQLTACGDATGTTDTFGMTGGLTDGTSAGSSGTSPTGPGPTEASGTVSDSATGTGSASQGSMSEPTTGPTSAGPTSGPTTDSATTLPDTDPGTSNVSDTNSSTGGAQSDTMVSTGSSGGVVSDTSGSTGGQGCAPDKQCNDECCAPDQLCIEAQCQKDCGGPPPCGQQQDCCNGQEICYLGECVVPGDACDTQQCATKVANDCGIGNVCDSELKLCLPSKADLNCIYKPPAQTFKPVPTFTWGKRKVVACTMDSQCQTAESCVKKVCTPGWPHLDIGVNDRPTFNQSSSTAAVVDLDQDCVPEIIFNSYTAGQPDTNGVLRIIRGDNGAKIFTNTDTNYDTNSTASPAVGDLDYDGKPEILVPGEGKNILAFSSTGAPLWKSDVFTAANVSSAVAIANLDNDGDAEVIYADAIFNSKGKKLFEGTQGEGKNGQGPISCVADLDGDGYQELIAGKTAFGFSGKVALNTFTVKQLWNSAVVDGFCGVADFNGDKKPEVIIVGSAKIYALNPLTGAKLAEAPIPNGGSGGPPNIADFDGDGKPEVAAAGSSQYIVYKYDGAATFTKLWSAPTDDTSSQVTGSSVFDFDGDGRNEVVYNDEVYLRIYPGVEPDCLKNPKGPACDGNMTDAEVLFRDKNGSRTRTEYPVIADVDGDFKAEIIFPTNNDGGSGVLDSGLEVWGDSLDNWVSTRPVWNQHTYHITNVGLVGEIPLAEPPSWATPAMNPYNSYRRNAQGAKAFCAPDLQVYDLDVDYVKCPDLAMSVWVANLGCLGVGPGVPVSFYEQNKGYLGTAFTKGPLAAGAAEQVTLSVPNVTESVTIHAVVDDDGKGMGGLNECKESNNETEPLLVCVVPK